MIKAVMFSMPNNRAIDRVYTAPMMDKLKSTYDLYGQPIGPHNAEEHLPALASAEIAFSTWGMPAFTVEQIKAWMPNLKALFYGAGSVQGFGAQFIDAGVRLFSAWGANAIPVAQVSVSQIILANKGFYQSAVIAREDRRRAQIEGNQYPGNYAVSVGLLGAGMIGRLVIQGLQKMQDAPGEIDILVFDPFLPDQKATELGVRKTTLEEIFETCQTVSNHLANKKEIEGIVNYDLFRRMPRNATFINTGRGAQINEKDLYRALTEEPLRAAVLDVTYPEPHAEGDPLFLLPNVFHTPHLAGSIGRECARHAAYMIEEARRMLAGEPVRFEVSRDMLATMA